MDTANYNRGGHPIQEALINIGFIEPIDSYSEETELADSKQFESLVRRKESSYT